MNNEQIENESVVVKRVDGVVVAIITKLNGNPCEIYLTQLADMEAIKSLLENKKEEKV